MVLKILALIGLVRLLTSTERPLLCAGLYAGLVFVLGLLYQWNSVLLIIMTLIALQLASGYFVLLHSSRFEERKWWTIAVLGLVIGLL